MSDKDFDEFLGLVGKDIAVHRICLECHEFYITNPDTYDHPKIECDPGFCSHQIPICLCRDGESLDSETYEECTYPNCRCGTRRI